ncbi:hypothetical protein VQ056_03915 [Paenibacillus sp. JTLBN-2024]
MGRHRVCLRIRDIRRFWADSAAHDPESAASNRGCAWKAGHEISQLAAESKELLAQTSATLSQLKARTEEVKPFCESLKLAGESLSNTVQRADAIAQLVTDTAMERLEKARRENELRLAEAFRWLDAGLSVWQSIKRQSPSPADDDA